MKKIFESTTEEDRSSRSRRARRVDRQNKYKDLPYYYSKNTKKIEPVIPKRPKDYKEPDYTLDGSIKQLFLNLTKMQITFGKEETLEEFFPEGMQEDNHGNYFIKIGDSKTMFCGHLDTYSREYKRVYHIIQDDIIMTDGTTTLGGDDKAGIVIMIKMIEAGIPGLYYFFRGEEGVTSPTGTWGSKQALKSYKDIFKTYEKCIAFDRKGFSSIISQQMYSECCSSDFVNALSSEFKKYGLDYKDDKTGMWCDSGVFMELIPECTNISVGYTKEHTYQESQDMEHLEKLVDACIKINWESLPVKRDPKVVTKRYGRYNYDFNYEWDYDYGGYSRSYRKTNLTTNINTNISTDNMTNQDIFNELIEILSMLNYECLNPESFQEAEDMYFQNVKEDEFFAIKIVDKDIYMTEDDELRHFVNYGDFETFKKYVMSGLNETDIILNKKTIDDKERLKTYEKIIEMYPYLIFDVIDDFDENLNTTVNGDNWIKLDKIMIDDLKLHMDYISEDGYNPDDFVDWIKEHQDIILSVLAKKIKQPKQSIPNKKFKDKTNSFLDYLEVSEYYTDRQDAVFSYLVEKERKLVQLIILDIDIMKTSKVRQNTLQHIKDTMIKNGYKDEMKDGHKNINANEFVLWVFDYIEEIEKFYKENPIIKD